MSEAVYIVGAKRTPVGSFLGSLSKVAAPRLGEAAIRAALSAAHVPAEKVDECIMGNVLTAGVGQAPARQAAIFAGLPQSTECMTINKVCGSGLKSVMLLTDSLRTGNSQIGVAGGQENMSLAPYLSHQAREGFRMGHSQFTDSMIFDGLWDPYNNIHMGQCAEICAKEYKFSREAQDDYAKQSYELAQSAQKNGWFKSEIAPVEFNDRKNTVVVDEDEEPSKARFDKMSSLRPAFEKDGTITAANASKINDGAAAVVLATESAVKNLKLQPIAKIISHASFAQDPKWFTTAPIKAIEKCLLRANLKTSDIDLYEINEAFAVVAMAAIKGLSLSRDQVNIHGGAIAIGHPIGASGTRLLTTLLYALERTNTKRGLVTLCIGGGEGAALIVERV
ncbi:MAG: acetyl-CoA C-acyltransferase [Bdellovibrionales bacterium CG10_big_fil_rev_8_21_14_0_10_45_34]|nr:MAG: acetyl-CoA C-acyltransferase [Bdellovibrionales bacterium CG10_big_fil_rev_8_21_14_0_10_45_34]